MKDYAPLVAALKAKGYYLNEPLTTLKSAVKTELWDHKDENFPSFVIRRGVYSELADIYMEMDADVILEIAERT